MPPVCWILYMWMFKWRVERVFLITGIPLRPVCQCFSGGTGVWHIDPEVEKEADQHTSSQHPSPLSLSLSLSCLSISLPTQFSLAVWNVKRSCAFTSYYNAPPISVGICVRSVWVAHSSTINAKGGKKSGKNLPPFLYIRIDLPYQGSGLGWRDDGVKVDFDFSCLRLLEDFCIYGCNPLFSGSF